MPRSIRVMIVDDSLIVRRLVEDSLREVDGIEVVGTAANGRLALERVGALAPDVVTLDVEMPELDGLATLRRLRAQYPRIHVIMFSSLTTRAAGATLDALAAGAADYVAKPVGAGGMSATRAQIRDQLVPKIRALCAREPAALASPAASAAGLARPRPFGSICLVAIGASTGGPAALHALFAQLPPESVTPIVIVQHVPPMFSRLLAERLAGSARRPVAEVAGPTVIKPGQIWLAPGDHHVVVRRRGLELIVELDHRPPQASCRPSVDVLFESVADSCASEALGVVLTGMGQDGLQGCTALRGAGGRVIVQDAASSVVWGMPGAVARAGLADQVLDLRGIAGVIAAAGPPPARAGQVAPHARR